MSRRKQINLSAYYDAGAGGKSREWGSFSVGSEDKYFDNFTRPLVISRLRREVRNNPFLSGLYNKFPESMGTTRFRSRTSDREYNEVKDQFFYKWAKSVTNTDESMSEVEGQIWPEMLVAGECFFVKQINGRFQMITSEFCGSHRAFDPKDPDGEVNGIGYYEKSGRPKYYRFGKMTPSGMIDFTNSEKVPARHVIHLFKKDRVQMGRGLPWLLPCLAPARDLAEIFNSKTSQIKAANKVAGFLEVENSKSLLDELSDQTDSGGSPVVEDLNSPVDASQHADAEGDREVKLDEGTFFALEPGEKVKMLMTTYNADDYKELVMLMLNAMSAPIGLPVELWFSGLGRVNFSGFKGLGTIWLARRSYYHEFIDRRFFEAVYSWRNDKAFNEGDLAANPDKDDDLFEFVHSKASVLDDEREGRSNKVKLDSGECCHSEIWEKNGSYTEEVFEARRQTWIKMLVASGELKEGESTDDIKVPKEFLLNNQLPKEPVIKPTNKPEN